MGWSSAFSAVQMVITTYEECIIIPVTFCNAAVVTSLPTTACMV